MAAIQVTLMHEQKKLVQTFLLFFKLNLVPCVHIYINMYIYIHIYTYIYTYIMSPELQQGLSLQAGCHQWLRDFGLNVVTKA